MATLPQTSASSGDGEAIAAGELRACQAGDRAALERLFTAYAPRVYRWSVFLGLSAQDAEDAAQETLAIGARRIDTCRSPAILTSWLFQITRRVVANARRTAWMRRIFRSEEGTDEPAFEPGGTDPGLELGVRRSFRQLNRAQAEVLLLAGVEGYTVPEVAQMLGLPEGTVASRLRLARAAFERVWNAS